MLESKESTLQEKLDFTIHLTCGKFMVGHLSHKDILTELLKSGQLIYKVKKEIILSQDFDVILNLICNKCNLTLVEQINDTASLYGHSLKGHHVCLLLKCNVSKTFYLLKFNIINDFNKDIIKFFLQKSSRNLVIEGKGDNNTLLSGIGDEILRILT